MPVVGVDLPALVADLGRRPLPQDPAEIEELRAVARGVVRRLPADHPLAGIDVSQDGAALLVRLLVHLSTLLSDASGSA